MSILWGDAGADIDGLPPWQQGLASSIGHGLPLALEAISAYANAYRTSDYLKALNTAARTARSGTYLYNRIFNRSHFEPRVYGSGYYSGVRTARLNRSDNIPIRRNQRWRYLGVAGRGGVGRAKGRGRVFVAGGGGDINRGLSNV